MIRYILILFAVTGYVNTQIFNVFTEKVYKQIVGFVNFALRREGDISITSDVTFNLYTRANQRKRKILYNDMKAIKSSYFNASTPTIFIIHGYTDHKHRDIIVALRKVLIEGVDGNIIVLDWGRLASQIYFTAAANSYFVGRQLGLFLEFLEFSAGVNLTDVHLIGHSLGAHVAGVAGDYLEGRIGRITGLDPAGPLFEFISKRNDSVKLDKTDAQFVDVIHTAGSSFGITLPCGHADFYPNDGSAPQPGCTNLITTISCSHIRSIDYFMESITGIVPFYGKLCTDWKGKELTNCVYQKQALMGFYIPKSTVGNYYLQTREKRPFALGKKFYSRKYLHFL